MERGNFLKARFWALGVASKSSFKRRF